MHFAGQDRVYDGIRYLQQPMGYPSDGHREEKPLRLWPKKFENEANFLERLTGENFCCLYQTPICGVFFSHAITHSTKRKISLRSKACLTCRSLASWTCQRFTRPFPWPLTVCVVLCGVPSVVMPWVCLFVGTMAARGRSNATTGGLYQVM